MRGFAIIARPRLIALAVVLATAIAGAPASASAARPSFSTDQALSPGFDWDVSDYVVRCQGSLVHVSVELPDNWQGRVNSGAYRGHHFIFGVPLSAGKAFRVGFRRPGHHARTFHVRCLPSDFPDYTFTRTAPGGPPFFIDQLLNHYVGIFNRDGVPVWWFQAEGSADNPELLPDGTLAWDPVSESTLQTGDYRVHTLTGKLVRVVKAAQGATDVHELLLLPNGNYLVGAQVQEHHVDTTPYGGSSTDDTVTGASIQEVTPDGQLVWKWDSADHIGLDETPQRWWEQIHGPFLHNDIVHWNSADPAGKLMLLSFRHLDAIYAINRKAGKIVWKLGGTETSKSLEVLNDPRGSYPFGGQHDARVLPDGTISVHDNRTGLHGRPRVVRYRIDRRAGTAKLVQSFSEPEITGSICCGSARRLPSGDWLVNWGGNPYVAGYSPTGERLFKFIAPGGFAYRANPVLPGELSARRLRHAMNNMAG